jgi:hypothetical protein
MTQPKSAEPHVVSGPSTAEQIAASDNRVIRENAAAAPAQKSYVVGMIEQLQCLRSEPHVSPGFGAYWTRASTHYAFRVVRGGKLEEFRSIQGWRVIAREADAALVAEVAEVDARIASAEALLKALHEEKQQMLERAVPRLAPVRVKRWFGKKAAS